MKKTKKNLLLCIKQHISLLKILSFIFCGFGFIFGSLFILFGLIHDRVVYIHNGIVAVLITAVFYCLVIKPITLIMRALSRLLSTSESNQDNNK